MKVIFQKVELPDKREMLFIANHARGYKVYERRDGSEWEPLYWSYPESLDIPRDALVSQWPGKEATA